MREMLRVSDSLFPLLRQTRHELDDGLPQLVRHKSQDGTMNHRQIHGARKLRLLFPSNLRVLGNSSAGARVVESSLFETVASGGRTHPVLRAPLQGGDSGVGFR